MKKLVLSLLTVSAAAFSVGSAFASDAAPLTRDQVRQELAQAQRNGDMVVNGESGQTAREARPDLFPAKAEQGKTFAQVRAELVQAQREGALPADGESGQTLRQARPDLYR